jgi:hypothetical protein
MIVNLLEKLIFNTLFEDYSLEIEFDKEIFEKEFPELNFISQDLLEQISHLSFSLKNNNHSVYFSYNFLEEKAKVAHVARIPFTYFYFELHITFSKEKRKIIFQGETGNKDIIKTFKIVPLFKVI